MKNAHKTEARDPETSDAQKCLRCGHLAVEVSEGSRICLCTASGQAPLLEKNRTMLTPEECQAIYDLVGMMSGSYPEYVFSEYAAGEPDDPKDPTVRAFAKVYECAGQHVPENLKGLEYARTTPDLDTIVGELQSLAVLFERQAELLEENPVVPPGFIKTYRKCAGKVRATIDRLGLNPYTESEALVGTHPEVVKLIRETSMASDQVGDELAFKVHSKLWDPARFTPQWVQEKEYAFPLGMIRKLDEDEAWALIVRVLKQIGHY